LPVGGLVSSAQYLAGREAKQSNRGPVSLRRGAIYRQGRTSGAVVAPQPKLPPAYGRPASAFVAFKRDAYVVTEGEITKFNSSPGRLSGFCALRIHHDVRGGRITGNSISYRHVYLRRRLSAQTDEAVFSRGTLAVGSLDRRCASLSGLRRKFNRVVKRAWFFSAASSTWTERSQGVRPAVLAGGGPRVRQRSSASTQSGLSPEGARLARAYIAE
jgi:hypothetical protein